MCPAYRYNGLLLLLATFISLTLFENGSTAYAQSVAFRIDATNANGDVVDSVPLGEKFFLNTYVQDVRANSVGVFAAYLDIEYAPLANVLGEPTFGDQYPNGQSGQFSDGLMNDIGAFGGVDPVGTDELHLIRIEMEATTVGETTFLSKFADNPPMFDVLVFDSLEPRPASDIDFGSYTLSITAVPEPSSLQLFFVTFVCLVTLRRRRRPFENG